MGGTPVFTGTRIPVQTLFDYIEAGDSIGDFLEGFPTVTKEQVIGLLEQAKEAVIESLRILLAKISYPLCMTKSKKIMSQANKRAESILFIDRLEE